MAEDEIPIQQTNTKRTKIISIIIYIAVLIGLVIYFVPQLVHGLDSGKESVDISECTDKCSTSTHNILLTGGSLLTENYITDENTKENYIAFVPENWMNNDPVYAIIALPPMEKTDIVSLSNKTTLPVIKRTILWEGIPGRIRKQFSANTKLQLASAARLFEYEADTETEFWKSILIIGIAAITLAAISIIISGIQRKSD